MFLASFDGLGASSRLKMDTMIELVSPLFTHSYHFPNLCTVHVVTSDYAISLGTTRTLVLPNFLPIFLVSA